MLQLTQVFLMSFKLVKFDFALYPENALCEVVNRRTIEIPQWTHIFKLTTDSFRVSLFIDLRCPWNLGKRSGCFMIIKWPISWFVYQWRHFRNAILLRRETACGLCARRHISLIQATHEITWQSLGTFMVVRPILQGSYWWKFSIWKFKPK